LFPLFGLHLNFDLLVTHSIAIPGCFLHSERFFYLLVNVEGKIIGTNTLFSDHFQQVTKTVGYFTDFLPEQDKTQFWQWIQQAKLNQKRRFGGSLDLKHIGKDTNPVMWEFGLISNSATDGLLFEGIGFYIENVDFQVESSSKVKRLETIVSNSIDVQLLIDASGYVFFCSPNMDETLGYSAEEIIGKNGFLYIHPDDLEQAKSMFSNEMTNPGNNSAIDIRFQQKNGEWLWAEVKGKNLLMEPSVQGMLININDITERKKLEEELLLKENLRHKQVAQAAVDAQEKERADIGKELHDNISQMLTSTKLFLDILKNKQPDELLERSVNNINAIIKEVRSLSRSLVPSSISDLGLVASLHDLLENIRAANVIEVEFYPATEEEMPMSPNSKLTLYRIAQEQINNIVRHSGATQVFVELYPEEDFIEMVISDNGSGFNPQTVKLGMGLKNIRSRAELLNGRSEIITSPGKGCKLKVNIPISKSSS
jgi:PAS domain S-box-containing protein